jgi:hypothetical protein
MQRVMNTITQTTMACESPQDRGRRRAGEIFGVGGLPAQPGGAALVYMPPAPLCNDGCDVSAPAFTEPRTTGGARPSSPRPRRPSGSARPGSSCPRAPAAVRPSPELVVSPGKASARSAAPAALCRLRAGERGAAPLSSTSPSPSTCASASGPHCPQRPRRARYRRLPRHRPQRRRHCRRRTANLRHRTLRRRPRRRRKSRHRPLLQKMLPSASPLPSALPLPRAAPTRPGQ